MNLNYRIFSAGCLTWFFSFSSFATLVPFEYLRTLASDPESGQIHRDYVLCFSPSGSSLVTTGHDDAIKVWTGDITVVESPTHIEPADHLTVLLFHPSGQYLASAGLDVYPTVVSWDWDGQAMNKLERMEVQRTSCFGWCQSLAMDPTGELLASTGYSVKIIIWRWSGSESTYLRLIDPGSSGLINVLVFHPIEKILLSAGHDKAIRLLRFEGDEAATFQTIEKEGKHGHKAAITMLACHPSGECFASADEEGLIKLWQWDGVKAKHRQTLSKKLRHIGRINTLIFHPSGQLPASAGNDGTIKLWQL